MKRKQFLQVAATSLLAVGAEGVRAKVFDENRVAEETTESGIAVRFLGTGAADWAGKDARGEHRRNASILVDGHILVDLTPSALDMLPEGCRPDTIFYTHSHGDHYRPSAALKAGVKRVYLSQTWYDIARADFMRAAKELKVAVPQIIPIYVGQPVIIGELSITPLPASHATDYVFEQTLIYLIEKQGARLIYATDTGGIPAVAAKLAGIDAHEASGKPITALIMEATMGSDRDDDFRMFAHTSVAGVERIVRVLEKCRRYTPPTGQPVYLTHLARTMHPTHKELNETLLAPLVAAYDGLEVVFRKP